MLFPSDNNILHAAWSLWKSFPFLPAKQAFFPHTTTKLFCVGSSRWRTKRLIWNSDACAKRTFVPFFSSVLFFLGDHPVEGNMWNTALKTKGNYLLEREQWSSFAPTPKSDSECCNCLPLTLTVILLRSAVTEYFSVAFQKLSFSLSRRTGDASNVIESLGLTYFFSTPALCFTGGRAERVRKRQEKQQIGLFKISRHCSPSTRPLKCDLRSVCDLCKYIGCHSKPFILTHLKGPLIKAKHVRRFYTVSLTFLCWSKSMEIAAFFGVMF